MSLLSCILVQCDSWSFKVKAENNESVQQTMHIVYICSMTFGQLHHCLCVIHFLIIWSVMSFLTRTAKLRETDKISPGYNAPGQNSLGQNLLYHTTKSPLVDV